IIARLGSPGLLRLVRERSPDVVVSTFPQTTEVLAHLRRRGALEVPVVAAVTDVAALHYWAAPGVDVHLVTFPESVPEVRRVAARAADPRCVPGLPVADSAPPRAPGSARGALGPPAEGKVVLVSGGGWGVGDLDGAVHAALAVEGVAEVVCLCGR